MQSSTKKMKKSEIQYSIAKKVLTIFGRNFEIEERCKGVHCVDLGESFPTHIFLQKLASITADNERCKVCPLSAYRSPRST